MPLLIKPRTLAVMSKPERRKYGTRYVVAVLAAFDLADSSKLDGEQALWIMAVNALPPGGALDICMPKPRAEMLIGGRVQAPDCDGLLLEAELAGRRKRIAVFGDRWWRASGQGYAATPPQPLTDLLLSPEVTFGGQGHRTNGKGRGFGAAALIGSGQPVPLPNVEDPQNLIYTINDEPPPAEFGPMDLADPERAKLAGTFDQAWLENAWPALPDDTNPEYFMLAPKSQRFEGYLRGDEAYRLRNFSRAEPEIAGRLPGVRPRAFVGLKKPEWVEIELRLDTVWLFAGARRGVLIWHGVAGVDELDGKDVTDVMVARERMVDPPRPIEHYAEVRRLRMDPEQGPRYAFSEWQLTPPTDPEADARRLEARKELARRRAAEQAEAMNFVMNRKLDEAGVPLALRPAPMEPDPDPIPMPTPQDIAEGNFDLGDMLDALEKKSREAEEKLRELSEQGTPVLKAMGDLQRPGAGANEVDALLASLAPLGGGNFAEDMDAAVGKAKMPLPDLDGDPVPPVVESAFADAAKATDWRNLIVEALKGNDDEKVLQAARARFLALPEASPFKAARDAIADAGKIELPAMPPAPDSEGPPPPPPPPPPAEPVAALLASLAKSSDLSAEQIETTTQKIADMEQRLVEALPGLKGADGRSALDELLAQVAPSDPEFASMTAEEKLAKTKDELAALGTTLDEAEPRLAAGIAAMRLSAPQAGYPQEVFSPNVARRFGDLIIEEIRSGIDLRGRDLAGANLAGADLSGRDLTGAFLERANLANTKLVGAILVEATLTQARLDHADLSGADLSRANLSGVSAPNVRLAGARLETLSLMRGQFPGARMRGAVLRDVSAIEANFDGADFSEARLDDCTFLKGTFRGVVFVRGRLQQCVFLQSALDDVDFSGAFVNRSGMIGVQAARIRAVRADLCGTNFIGNCMLAGGDFSAALASDGSFYGADLTGARFTKAVLDRTAFGDAKLAGASFRLASMREVFLSGGDLADADLIGAQMMEARLRGGNLSRAILRGANLFSADISDADITGADFTGADVTKTILSWETTNA